MPRRKALIIGINYTGSSHELNGCVNDAYNVQQYLVEERGFSSDERNMVLLTDEEQNAGTPFEPTAENIMHAFEWLVTCNNEGDSLWLSYSGHGGQVRDASGERDSGFDDTICPLDFEQSGQITSDTLHRQLVSRLRPNVRLTVLLDCCHSGSALELPYVYRPDGGGGVNLMDNVKAGIKLIDQASRLVEGGFRMDKLDDARALMGGARTFFRGLQHRRDGDEEPNEDGLVKEDDFGQDWSQEQKDVWLFSGCADNQTSADTSIAGAATGAMSYCFMAAMRENPEQSYLEILTNTRELMLNKYTQIPQLSVGAEYDLDQMISRPTPAETLGRPKSRPCLAL